MSDPNGDADTDARAADAAAIERFVREEYGGVLARVSECADGVVAGWEGKSTSDRAGLVPPLGACLAQAGVLANLAALLPEAADVLGESLSASPVPAPPYVVVTSTGPVARATLPSGRLVVAVEVFSVVRDGEVRYVRRDVLPPETLSVAFR